MLSKKQEGRAFSNGPLRDQWEKIAQSVADQNKQEAEWRQKSTTKIAGSKWNYHWQLVANGDFKKATSGQNEEDNKPKVKFKIVPPPPKPKPQPPPPPSPKKEPPPTPKMQKRKVVVDVFRLCWKDSWMSLKPPKYLYLKAKEMKARIQGFTTIEIYNNKKYKQMKDLPEEKKMEKEAEEKEEEEETITEDVITSERWRHSWKQVKSPAQLEPRQHGQFRWQVLYDRKLRGDAEIGTYTLPTWAGTWKIMNFPFRQYKPEWDVIWSDFEQEVSDKTTELQWLEEEEELEDWEDSWKLSEVEIETEDLTEEEEIEYDSEVSEYEESEYEEEDDYEEDYEADETSSESSDSSDTSMLTRINSFLMPGWSSSWMISAAPPVEAEERQMSWSSCWGYGQQFRWVSMLTLQGRWIHLYVSLIRQNHLTKIQSTKTVSCPKGDRPIRVLWSRKEQIYKQDDNRK